MVSFQDRSQRNKRKRLFPHLGVIGDFPDISFDAAPIRARAEVLAGVLFLFGDPTGRLFRVFFEPVVGIGDGHGSVCFAFVNIGVIRTTRLGVAVRDPGVGSHRLSKRTCPEDGVWGGASTGEGKYGRGSLRDPAGWSI